MYSGTLLYNDRVVVPSKLHTQVLQRLHEGHQGIDRCRARLRSSVWWPRVNQQLSDLIERCQKCAKVARKRREPLLSNQLPQYPWQSTATELDKKTYVVTVDYYSGYPEVLELKSTTSGAVNTVPEQKQEINDHDSPSDSEPEREPPQRIVTRSQTGTTIQPPDYLGR